MLIVEALRRWGIPLLGAAALIVGVVLLLAPTTSASFGWSANAPLSDTSFVPVGMAGQRMLGAVLAVAGALTVLVWALRARRRRHTPPAG